jgi:hypothetical protein
MSETTIFEPTLIEWDAKEYELADNAAKPDSENVQSAFNRISAEAEAVMDESQSCSSNKIWPYR